MTSKKSDSLFKKIDELIESQEKISKQNELTSRILYFASLVLVIATPTIYVFSQVTAIVFIMFLIICISFSNRFYILYITSQDHLHEMRYKKQKLELQFKQIKRVNKNG